MLPIWCKDNEGKWVRIPYEILYEFGDGTWGFYIYTDGLVQNYEPGRVEFYNRCRNNFRVDKDVHRLIFITTEEQVQLKVKEQELAKGKPR